MDCSECDPDDPTMCVTCSEGYRKDSNGDCKCKNIFPGHLSIEITNSIFIFRFKINFMQGI